MAASKSGPDSASTSLLALVTAAATLPIVAVPLRVSAQAFESELIPPLLPVGAAFGFRTLAYRETGNRMSVDEPVWWMTSPLGERWTVAASATVDIVSGASTLRVSNSSGRPVQIRSGASITDRRRAADVSVKYRHGDTEFGLGSTRSREEDYVSRAWSLRAAFDFNARNTTLAVSYGASNDRVGSTDDPRLNERRSGQEVLVSITQILDRHSLLQSNLLRVKGAGFYSDPYRSTLSQYRDNGFPPLIIVADNRPSRRDEWSWLTRYKRNLPAQKAVLSGDYRYYRDSWGIRSHTWNFSWLQALNNTWKVEPGIRYHTQRKAHFYAPEISDRPAPVFHTSDQRLAAFGALEPSIRVVFQLTTATAVDLGISHYRQQGNWRLGRGSTAFEPLTATLVNSGIVHRF